MLRLRSIFVAENKEQSKTFHSSRTKMGRLRRTRGLANSSLSLLYYSSRYVSEHRIS